MYAFTISLVVYLDINITYPCTIVNSISICYNLNIKIMGLDNEQRAKNIQ